MERSEILEKASEEVLTLLTSGLAELKEKNVSGINEARILEIYNKIITVCLNREQGKVVRDETTNLTDDELESSF